MKHMVFGVVTAIDLLNFVTAREKRERSISECTDELWEKPAVADLEWFWGINGIYFVNQGYFKHLV